MFFINSRNKENNDNDKFFDFEKVDFDYIDILQTFSAAKIILEAYLEPSKASPIKIFCGFLKETPP